VPTENVVGTGVSDGISEVQRVASRRTQVFGATQPSLWKYELLGSSLVRSDHAAAETIVPSDNSSADPKDDRRAYRQAAPRLYQLASLNGDN
jgi:hypothetical protein